MTSCPSPRGAFRALKASESRRESLKMGDRNGVYVRGLLPLSPAQKLILPGVGALRASWVLENAMRM